VAAPITSGKRPNSSDCGWPVPAQVLAALAIELAEQSVDLSLWLAGTRLTPKCLTDGGTVVAYDQMTRLIRRGSQLSGRDALGLTVGMRQTPIGLGLLGFAISCCTTLRDALNLAAKYYRVASTLVRYRLCEAGDYAHWIVDTPNKLGDIEQFVLEQEFAAFLTIVERLIERPLPISRIQFVYPEPSSIDLYRKAFGCSMSFNANAHELEFKATFLDCTIAQANGMGIAYASRLCDSFLAAHPISDDVVMKVRYLLLVESGRLPNEEEVARHLFVTSRTLRNRLRRAGQTYQGLLDEVREERARTLLRETPSKVEVVAEQLQFSSARSFRRAFVQWTGLTPQAYRLRGVTVEVDPGTMPTA